LKIVIICYKNGISVDIIISVHYSSLISDNSWKDCIYLFSDDVFIGALYPFREEDWDIRHWNSYTPK